MAQHYDVSLKLLFRNSHGLVAKAIFGGTVQSWLNVELPKVQNPRVDLLARRGNGVLCHLELESKNTRDIGRRVTEYYLGLHRLLDDHVEMVVLYVGRRPLAMKPIFSTPSLTFTFRLIDIREFDGEPLIKSNDLGDNMLALLTKSDQEIVFQKVEARLKNLPPGKREEAALRFVVISGLRGLEKNVARRLKMIDLMENKVIGPAILLGERRGERRGQQRGEHRGKVKFLLTQLKQRFGPLPAGTAELLEQASERKLLSMSKRILTAKSLDAVVR